MFEITNLFLYKLLFMLNLIIAETLFLFRLSKKPRYPWRMALCTVFSFVFVFFFPILSYDAVYSSIMFSVFFLLTIVTTKICYDINWQSTIFCTVAGYSMQHLASSCYDIVITVSRLENTANVYSNESPEGMNLMQILILVEVYALVYWILFHVFGNRIKRNEDITIKSVSLLILLVLTVLVEIVLNAFVIYRKYEALDMVYYMASSITNIICSLSLLMVQFGLLLNRTMEKELDIVHQMWYQEQKQFLLTKETIDLINTKCHDMRHQIHAITQRGAIDKDALREIEEVITIYDSIAKTGSQALDIILAEKSLFCANNQVFVSYIADGEKLRFVSDTDVYSLFGNLLDNAIQTVLKLEQDKRVVSLTIKAEGELLSINSHNYYSGDIRMMNGLPVTDNPDKDYHGFGVKSMVMIVEKYFGSITFEAKDGIFNINILLPISDARSAAGQAAGFR